MKTKKCPFCGGTIEVVCVNEWGENFGEGYLDDYPDANGEWSFALVHDHFFNDCPIAMSNKKFLGDTTYGTKEEAINACNMRA